MRAVALTGMEEAVRNRGGDFAAFLREVGLPAQSAVDIDLLISFPKMAALMEAVAHKTNSPNFGLEWAVGLAPDFANVGPIMLLSRFSDTLEEWLELGIRYWNFHTNGFSLKLIKMPQQGIAIFRITDGAFVSSARHIHESAMATVVGLARHGTGKVTINPSLVRFRHRKPADVSAHESYFGCKVDFGFEHTEVEFPYEYLSYKTAGGLRLFRPLIGFFMQRRIKMMKSFDQSTTTAVAFVIPSIIGSGNCNIEFVAEALNIHIKQMQRQLAAEGTNFSDILESVREKMAKTLLVETKVPISRIAGLLDYSATAPFSTAFQRWTGSTPLRYRKQERAKR